MKYLTHFVIIFLFIFTSGISAKETEAMKIAKSYVLYGDVEGLKLFLDKGFNVNKKYLGKDTLLHFAVQGNQIEIAKLLIKHGSNLNAKEEFVLSPLHLAVKENYFEMVNLLIESGANINIKGDTGVGFFIAGPQKENTPLHMACSLERFKIAELLINKGADLNLQNAEGNTPLYYVLENIGYRNEKSDKKIELVKLMISKGANPKIIGYGLTPLQIVVKENRIELVNLFLSKGADPNQKCKGGQYGGWKIQGTTPLHVASTEKHLPILKLLLSKGVKINEKDINDCTPLFYFAGALNLEGTKLLVENGAELNIIENTNGNSILHEIINRAYPGSQKVKILISYLIPKGLNFKIRNKLKYTPYEYSRLWDSNSEGPIKRDVGNFILGYDTELQEILKIKTTPLHFAISQYGNEKLNYCLVEQLIKDGWDVNTPDNNGETILFPAIRASDIDIVNLLLKNKADPNIHRLGDGNTPLHIICCGTSYERNHAKDKRLYESCFNNGANIEEKNKNDETVFQYACLKTPIEIDWWMQWKPNINSQDINGNTILHDAIINDKFHKIPEIFKIGVDVNIKNKFKQTAVDLAKLFNLNYLYQFLNDYITTGEIEQFNPPKENVDDNEEVIRLRKLDKEKAQQYLQLKKIDLTIKNFFETCGPDSDSKILALFFAAGFDVNKRRDDGETALTYAIACTDYNYSQENAIYLIKFGADPNLHSLRKTYFDNHYNTDFSGFTPLLWAIHFHHTNLVRLLLDKGANPNLKSATGITPLYHALRQRTSYDLYSDYSLEMCMMLLKAGANPNLQGNEGQTPLHNAVFKEKEHVALLLKYGADPTMKQKADGWSPLDRAEYQRYEEIVKLMRDAIEKKNLSVNKVP